MQTATNQKTGETVVRIGNEWKPFSKTATNNSGTKAYLVGDQWVEDKAQDDGGPGSASRIAELEANLPSLEDTRENLGLNRQKFVLSDPATHGEVLEDIAANPATKFATGASSLIRGGFENLPDAMGGAAWRRNNEALRQIQEAGEKRQGTALSATGTAADISGQVLSPIALKAAKAIPFLTGAKGFIPKTSQAAKNVGTGAAVGLGYGLLTPEGETPDHLDTKLDRATGDALIGGGAAAVLPPVLSGAMRAGHAAKQAMYPTPGAIGVKAAGDKVDDVINALMTQKSNVQGVNLTAGQASVPANNAEFAALQNLVARKEDPSMYFGPAGNKGRQEAARVAAVRKIGGTPEDLSKAVAARSAESKVNYAEAFDEIIKPDKGLRSLWKNPYFKDEVGEALKIFKARQQSSVAEGKAPKKLSQDLTEFLHDVKLGMDARLQSLTNPNAPAISDAAKGSIQNAKKQLVDWLKTKNPAYDTARISHIDASKPISQMKVGQDLERALVAPSTGAERASSFGSAKRKAETTISKGSGNPRIEDLTEPQRKVVAAIEEDFKRNAAYKELASNGAANLEKRIGSPEIKSLGIFNPLLSFARGRFNQVLGTGQEKALHKLSPLMESPQAMAEAMRAATPQQRKVIESMLSRYLTHGTIISATQENK